ncbi:PilZ domain-containing protein [Stieleria sp.]|uniref:PilZ domain-containing protein n=1 Tax=Stieleria sp. TaxID=2795976 RepID=UPI0035657D37
MLRLSGTAPNMDVENAIRDLLEEDAFYDRIENRSSHREHLVRPVALLIRGAQQEIMAFSRNVSAAGIGLITQNEIPERSTAVLTIESLKGGPIKMLAQCRWCRAYGPNWRISGWQFINMHR